MLHNEPMIFFPHPVLLISKLRFVVLWLREVFGVACNRSISFFVCNCDVILGFASSAWTIHMNVTDSVVVGGVPCISASNLDRKEVGC